MVVVKHEQSKEKPVLQENIIKHAQDKVEQEVVVNTFEVDTLVAEHIAEACRQHIVVVVAAKPQGQEQQEQKVVVVAQLVLKQKGEMEYLIVIAAEVNVGVGLYNTLIVYKKIQDTHLHLEVCLA